MAGDDELEAQVQFQMLLTQKGELFEQAVRDLIAGIEAFAAESLGSPGAAAEEGGTKEEEAFFWIDIFSVDENRAADPTNALPQAWWSSTFMDAIASIGQTVLVLSPWDAPRPCT